MKGPLLIVVGVLAAVLLFASTYTLSQTEQAILTQFGEPLKEAVTEPGLHFKVPFIQMVHVLDKRWLEYDGDPNEIPTRDKKYIGVDIYARWRISDPLKFYQAVRDERGAQSRLDDIIDGETRNAVASYDLIEIVRSSNRPFQVSEELKGLEGVEAPSHIATGREKIGQQILAKAAKVTPDYGIELVDVRFKRINYVESVQQKVFDRMNSERKRIAERSRSEGQGKAAEVRGQKERDVLKVSSEGYRKAQELKGAADAKATAIYARAYGKDPEFYQFVKTMDTLQASMDEQTWLILSTDSELFKYLKATGGP